MRAVEGLSNERYEIAAAIVPGTLHLLLNATQIPSTTPWLQGELPCLTSEGKIILSSTSSIATAPDGNGGVYIALQK